MPSDFFWIGYARRRRPQTSTFSTVPPPLRTTDRNASRLGATYRSSTSGSRMSMSSYLRMRVPHLLWTQAATVDPWQEGCCVSDRDPDTGEPAPTAATG